LYDLSLELDRRGPGYARRVQFSLRIRKEREEHVAAADVVRGYSVSHSGNRTQRAFGPRPRASSPAYSGGVIGSFSPLSISVGISESRGVSGTGPDRMLESALTLQT
jgi:hypothetical protein